MKIRFILACFLYLYCYLLLGQERFSKRFSFDYPAGEFTSIIATDSCYFVTGVVADSIFPYKTGNSFIRFSLGGDPLIAKFLTDTVKTYETWYNNLVFINDKLANNGYTTDTSLKVMLLEFNTQGDTVGLFEYEHPNYPESTYIFSRDFVPLEDGYLFANMIYNSNTFDYDIDVVKMNATGDIQWRHRHGILSKTEIPYSIVSTLDGYIIAGIKDNTNTEDGDEAQNYIFKSDWDGNIIWSYLSSISELRGKEGHAIPTSDGGLLVYTGDGILFGFVGQWRFHNYVFKLDSNQEEEWDVYVRDSFEAISYNNQLTSALELEDGTGYVVAGNLIEGVPDDLYFNGLLAKISPDGELLWKRYYQHLPSKKTRHYINDLDIAPDGGFIMVGEVRDSVDAPRQQGWLLKVDEYGCLVPDCHLLDTVVVATNQEVFTPVLLLYPNPTQDELRIYFKGQGADYHFRIVDSAGRMMQAFDAPHTETTLLLDVQQWANGVYYLQCLERGVLVKTEAFVKTE